MKKPNILFILSDDHGSWATGCYGNKDVVTPTIDKLAADGLQFNNFFCTSPVCSPARASIITGKIPSQHGIHDWLNGGNLNGIEYQKTELTTSDYNRWFGAECDVSKADKVRVYEQDLHKNSVKRELGAIDYTSHLETYPQLLNESGYNCGLAGKWHLGSTVNSPEWFNFWRPIAKGGTNYFYPEIIVDDKVEIIDQYVSEYVADQAIEFLNEQKADTPFYLSVHFTAPHSPWDKSDHPQHIWNLYDEDKLTDMDSGKINQFASPTAPYPDQKTSSKRLLHGYYTAITAMDEQIARIIEQLEKSGFAENTIIIYTSDNGMNLGQHGVWGKGNGTYPLNFYEESIKVPFVLYDPRQNGNKRIVSEMLSQYDLLPTLLEICGIEKKLDSSYPGQSFRQLLSGASLKTMPIVVFDEYGPNRMIRTERFKLIIRYDDGGHELYDLMTDPQEAHNILLSDHYKDVYHDLQSTLNEWFDKYIDERFNAERFKVTGFGQYSSVLTNGNPFELHSTKFKG